VYCLVHSTFGRHELRSPFPPRPRSGAAARRPIWADDGYGVASNLIYGVWPYSPGVLPASYEQKAIYVVQLQLEKAGVRLAAALDDTLR
jgi:hypothetical protein